MDVHHGLPDDLDKVHQAGRAHDDDSISDAQIALLARRERVRHEDEMRRVVRLTRPSNLGQERGAPSSSVLALVDDEPRLHRCVAGSVVDDVQDVPGLPCPFQLILAERAPETLEHILLVNIATIMSGDPLQPSVKALVLLLPFADRPFEESDPPTDLLLGLTFGLLHDGGPLFGRVLLRLPELSLQTGDPSRQPLLRFSAKLGHPLLLSSLEPQGGLLVHERLSAVRAGCLLDCCCACHLLLPSRLGRAAR